MKYKRKKFELKVGDTGKSIFSDCWGRGEIQIPKMVVQIHTSNVLNNSCVFSDVRGAGDMDVCQPRI